ncbi:helix-turn-helix domain-containing protein [Geomonas sp. RF6]|uniref:helix-turn-helix domain-containing protein n=1 Tax=Geomonas sp. RF6 TaxID=2897342 RepID=UPI001E308E64|nr:helix-turn-helix transcriptional regulator [Geomonas sp. RF6]UFS69314.1 helix-turn-helix domain-containing protein [Geomonas sp. RF6]
MLERTKKRRTESGKSRASSVGADTPKAVARFTGPPEKIVRLRRFAERIGLETADDTSVEWRSVFPEVEGNKSGTMLKGARTREGLTQVQVAQASNIPQRHISEMENGKRVIGKDTAKRLAEVLHVDYRVFL